MSSTSVSTFPELINLYNYFRLYYHAHLTDEEIEAKGIVTCARTHNHGGGERPGKLALAGLLLTKHHSETTGLSFALKDPGQWHDPPHRCPGI